MWSILFQLIDGRSRVTDVIKVKSHLEDAGPSVIKQNKIAFHRLLANSLADVVAEEAAKRLLPDLNLERKAKKAERIGVGVAKRLALVQADIGAKRNETGDIYELDSLLDEEATCTWTVFSKLVDDLAHQGHLLVRHNKGLRCKVCNVYRADRQFKFWSRHPCSPRPSAAVVISHFRNKKRQYIYRSGGNSCPSLGLSGERHHCTSLGGQDMQCTHSHLNHLPPTDEHSVQSQHALTQLHVCGMEGKRRKMASFADPGGPRVPLRSNFDDPEGWDTFDSEEECVQRDVVQRMALDAGRPIIRCGNSGCTGACLLSVVEYGHKAGMKPATCGTCGKIFPAPEILWNQVSKRLSHQVSKVTCTVRDRSTLWSVTESSGNSFAGRYGPL